ncbi:MAG: putative 2OG-Fe(II) oxygenase [Erythrobacter sp.]|nr:putative 2OG-Fe(II) oxygenase [Erythrobacter sp.]
MTNDRNRPKATIRADVPGAPASPAEAMVRIRMALQRAEHETARQIAEAARRSHPRDAALADAAGDLALKAGDAAAAAEHFNDAVNLAPAVLDYALNYAIALQRLDQHREVIAVLAPRERQGRAVPRYASIRAMSHRALREVAQAARWYDAVLALEPRHPRGLHGRARVALERGENDAPARFDRALAVNPGDADLWLGKAQALEVAGDLNGARVIAEQLAEKAPGYIAGLSFLAGLKLAAGEGDYTSPFVAAARKAPQDPNIAAKHVETLAGLDHAAEAAAVAAEARKRFPGEPHFALLEAVHAGSTGDWERAEALFVSLDTDTANRALHEARHAIRAGQLERAEELLERALAEDPWDVTAWAHRGILWRLANDPRARWLHEQEGLIQMCPLAGREGLLSDCIDALRSLHEGSALPLGQSLRGGTQTRGTLFDRTEPILAELADAIRTTLNLYRGGLPPADPRHPMLRHRDTPWALAGSWSVRLTGGSDHHAAHIHIQGLISSALYLIVPEEAAGPQREGWLEIGRPKGDLGLDLPPIRAIEPVAGQLALFPSTAYHGTTPFRSAERMTVAFDAIAAEQD